MHASGDRLGPYELLAPIGAGGMGTVWKARDTRVGRTVAVKILKGPQNERFETEARAIAQISHPNICTLFDLGESGAGEPFIVMEFVDGKPVAGPLPEEETRRVGVQIARAMQEAHARGIVHRDLKPANVMVTSSGVVKVLDFGLAKLTISATDDTITQTKAGAIVGTVAYMSPEQAEGKPVDARSDVFSLGALLYELKTGAPAFRADSPAATLARILRDDPPPIPGPLGAAIRKCMRKNPAERYQSMAEAAEALEAAAGWAVPWRGLAAAVALLVLAAGGYWLSKKIASRQPAAMSLAVLPFLNQSSEPGSEAFADGLTDELIGALSRVPGIKVMGRASVFRYKGQNAPLSQLAADLKVDRVLQGSVRKSGDRLRITAQLANTSDGVVVWSDTYDRQAADVFDVQEELCRAMAGALKVRFGESAAVERGTSNIEAYGEYLRGLGARQTMTRTSIQQAMVHFREAIRLDPAFAHPWVALAAFTAITPAVRLGRSEDALRETEAALDRALSINPNLAEAHAIRSYVASTKRQWAAARMSCERALALEPRNPRVNSYCARVHLILGDSARGLELARRAVEIDPADSFSVYRLGEAYFYGVRRYDEALTQFRATLQLAGGSIFAQGFVATCLAALGRPGEAVQALDLALAGTGGDAGVLFVPPLAAAGQLDRARSLVEKAKSERAAGAFVNSTFLARAHFAVGDAAAGFEELNRAFDEMDATLAVVPFSALMDNYRRDPRYRAFLAKMNYPADAKVP